MSYGAKKIFPIDKKSRVAIGISIPFNQPGIFGSTYVTKDAIKTNLINFFLTDATERYLNPTFGGNLRKYIFEQLNNKTTDFLKDDIQTSVSKYFTSVIINTLEINQNRENNSMIISMDYSIKDTGINDSLQLEFQ